MRPIFSLACALAITCPAMADTTKTETVILVTIDGLRWQEVFGGADRAFFSDDTYIAHKKELPALEAAYDADDPVTRRAALMPFLWSVVATEGQLYGNRNKGSVAQITNEFHFSAPGYSEILTGIADPRVNSNDKTQNPNRTILGWLNAMPENRGKVAAFASWDVFPYIINEQQGGVPVNAGFEPYDLPDDHEVATLNRLLATTPSPWDTVRLDAFTMGFARAALRHDRMRFVYISLGETDDFAHDGQYDQYLNAARRDDQLIGEMWAWLQSDPRYKGKTTLLITTDHGRGSDNREAWKYHGRFPYTRDDGTKAISDFKGDDAVWIAAIGPDIPALGEISGGAPVSSTQIAATLARLMGYIYEDDNPDLIAGPAIEGMLGK